MTAMKIRSRLPRPETLQVGLRQQRRVAIRVGRARQRQPKGRLRDRVIAKTTLTRYRAVMVRLFDWMALHCLSVPLDTTDMDNTVMQWAECLWAEGDEKGVLGYGLSAIQHYVPSLRRRLNGSWRLHAAWGRDEPGKRAPPLTVIQMQGFAGWFVRQLLPDAAIVIMLAFGCILRTQEFLSLRTSDISFSGTTARLILRNTKIGQRLGVTQETYTQDGWLVPRLQRLCEKLPKGSLILGIPGWRFRRLWADARKEMQLPATFTPYSLRRGGATALFQKSGSYDRVTDIGRWKSIPVCRLYINTAIQELAADELGPLYKNVHSDSAKSLHRLR